MILLALAGLPLAGCGGGGKTIKADGAEQSVTGVVARKTHFTPTDVSCPSGVDAVVGKTFDCHFTGPEGPYVAHVTITAVQGSSATFRIRTERAAAGSS
jgi:uncharacterized protein DUF4333